MKNTRNALTLVELLISVSLLSLIVLATFSLDGVSRKFMGSSQRISVVNAELMTAMTHIEKFVSQAVGINGTDCDLAGQPDGCYPSVINGGTAQPILSFRLDTMASTPDDSSDDRASWYSAGLTSALGWNLRYKFGPASISTLSNRMVACTFTVNKPINALVVSLTARFDPNKLQNSRDNPQVTINSTIHFDQVSAT
jgi:Tfp pilus assembly protein PilE